MGLDIVERRIGEVAVLDVLGSMTAENEPEQVSDTVRQRLGAGHRRLLLNLHEVDACDTAGLTSLVVCLAHARTKEAVLALAGLQPTVRRLLDVSGLLSSFPVFSDVGPAVMWIRRQVATPPVSEQ